MNRRDTIIVAVLLNAAVIAVLLMMAITTDEEILQQPPARSLEVAKESLPKTENYTQIETAVNNRTSEGPIVIDLEAIGFDNLLSDDFNSSADELFVLDDVADAFPQESPSKPSLARSNPSSNEDANVKIVEIVVKKGDSLDKIARANDTTIEAIKRLSQLKNEKLSIGQMLKVPVGYKKSTPTASTESSQKETPKMASHSIASNESSRLRIESPSDAVYYVVKSGDNPWKIAKQQQVNMDDLLRLNQLNEEKARNLRPGDKIRIR